MQQNSTDGLGLQELRQIAQEMKAGKGFAMVPTWIFDLEKCGSILTAVLKERSRCLGHSEGVKDRVPELENLRRAILKIGGICATGGFALSRESIYGILVSAIKDIEDYVVGKI